MSGVGEASLVLGLISSIIAIYEGAYEIYEAASDVKGLPRKFQLAAEQIPLVLHALGLAEQNIRAKTVSLDALQSAMLILERCKESAVEVKKIFDKTIPTKDASRAERYKKAVGIKLKSNKVKEHVEEVAKNMELLSQHQVFQDAETLKDIQAAVEQLGLIPDEDQPPQFVHSGGGPQIAHQGTGNVESYSHSGSGHINKAETQYIGTYPVHHHYPPREKVDFSFRKPIGVCLHVPRIDSELFIGRKSELDEIKAALQPENQSPQRRQLVLGGLGGIGKTQLAIAYAQRHHDVYKSVLWFDATSEMTLKGGFRSMAEAIFDVPELGVLEGEQILIHVRQWLSDPQNTRWLLIYDNYDDPRQFDIERYYPFGSHGAIIVTTRRPDLVNGRLVRIQPIQDIEESLEILQTRSGREGVKFDPAAKRLAERLDGLPLALATAGAYLSQSTFTFERYLQEYERRWNIDPRRPLQLQEYQNQTLYTTWDLSYARLKSEDPAAAKLLKVLAYFAHQNLWYELFRGGIADETPLWLREIIMDDVEFESVMRRLTAYCFVELQVPLCSWSMHTYVHDWTVAALNRVIDPQQYWYAFDCVAASIDENDWGSLGHLNYARLSPHASWLVQERFRGNELDNSITFNRVENAFTIAQLLTEQVQLGAAEEMYRRALAGNEKALGADHTSTLNTINNLGNLYRAQGKLDKAEEMYRRALAGKEKVLGADHTSTLSTVNNLGNLYHARGKLDKAEEMYRQALAGNEKALGADHTSTLDTISNLGLLYVDQGKLDKTEEMYQRALAGYEKVLGADHTSTLNTINNLGNLYRTQGKLNKAEEMYQQALAGNKKVLRTDHTLTLNTISNLGLLYADQGKLDEAEKMYRQALAGYEKALGADHTSTLITISNLGLLYVNQGKLDKAEKMYRWALAGKEKTLGGDHTSTLDTINNLGNLYRAQDKLDKAEEMYRQALAGYKKALGAYHTSTFNIINNLGSLYHAQGKLNKAEEMYRQALAGNEKALGVDHTSTLNTINNLGNVYRAQGKLNKAEKMYQQVLAGYEKVLGADHTSTLITISNLGLLYVDQGKLDEAEKMYRQALAGYEKALGVDQTLTFNTIKNLGNLYLAQGKLNKAEEMYRQALAGYKKVLGTDHTSTFNIINNLGLLYANQGKLDEAEKMYRQALAGYEKVLGMDHTSTLNTVNNLGNLYRAQGKLDEAEEMYRRALAGKEKTLGGDHPSILNTVPGLCTVLVSCAWKAKFHSTGVECNLPDKLNQLLQLALTWGSRVPVSYGALGRALLWTSDEKNVRTAFQQQILLQAEVYVYAGIQCDGCRLSISCDMKRLVCRECLDVDLCGQCFRSHEMGDRVVLSCIKHMFMEITPLDELPGSCEFSHLDEPSRASWIQNLMTPETRAIQRCTTGGIRRWP